MPDGSCLESNLLSEVGGGALTFGLTSDDGETVLERSDAISGSSESGEYNASILPTIAAR